MGTATVNICFKPVRLFTKADAAHYCCYRNVKTFEAECPVRPIRMANGELLYNLHDVDTWIDSLKNGAGFDGERGILERLR
jgi:hypothetical protein